LLSSIEGGQEYIARWLRVYNNELLNMAMGGIAPKQKLELAADKNWGITHNLSRAF